jgi:hypothetical protein
VSGIGYRGRCCCCCRCRYGCLPAAAAVTVDGVAAAGTVAVVVVVVPVGSPMTLLNQVSSHSWSMWGDQKDFLGPRNFRVAQLHRGLAWPGGRHCQ